MKYGVKPTFICYHHKWKLVSVVDPIPSKKIDGYREYKCLLCGKISRQIIP